MSTSLRGSQRQPGRKEVLQETQLLEAACPCCSGPGVGMAEGRGSLTLLVGEGLEVHPRGWNSLWQ